MSITDDGLVSVIDEDTVDWGYEEFVKEFHPEPLIINGNEIPF